MTKSEKRGENEFPRSAKQEAKRTGEGVCSLLERWLREAQKSGDAECDSTDSQSAKVSRLPKYPQAEANAMNWYCAHGVMFVELQSASQKQYPVWENVILFEAKDEEDAFEQAERHGRAEEGDDGGTFEWGEYPARWVFAGVRKLTQCDAKPGALKSGTEITYSEFELGSREDVMRLASGKPVQALFNDSYRRSERKIEHRRRSENRQTKARLACRHEPSGLKEFKSFAKDLSLFTSHGLKRRRRQLLPAPSRRLPTRPGTGTAAWH